jgi:hypothetical protein
VYWQVGDHEFLNLDDNDYVTENSHVVTGITGSNILWAFSSTEAANWHPITWLSHMADAQIYGMNPRGHHLTNLIIHISSTVLLFLLLFRLTGSRWQSSFVAALFALHPLHVESVAWVAERKDLLSAFFWFLTLFLYSSYVTKRKPVFYISSLISFVLGLMSKPMLVTIPIVMLLIDLWPLNRYSLKEQEPVRRQLLSCATQLKALVQEKILFFACSIFSAVITIYAQHKGGAISGFEATPFRLRVENAIVSYVEYIAKTIWPHDLAVYYPLPSSIPLWQIICSLLILLLVSVAVIWFGRQHPFLPVGWFWFIITLLPVIGLIQVGSQAMADRYTYIPHIGLFIIVAWGIPVLTKKLQYQQGIIALLAGVVIFSSAALTWRQLGYWRDDVSLYQRDLDVTTDNYIMHNHLGIIYRYKGELDSAIREYKMALAIEPNYPETHNNLGLALAGTGNRDAALKEFQIAIALNPNYSQAHNNLGVTLAGMGNLDAAIREYQAAITINPNDSDARDNMRNALAKQRH